MRIGWESSWGASQSCIPSANLDDYIFDANLENYIPDANPENYFSNANLDIHIKMVFFLSHFYPKTTFAPYENLDKCISDANLENYIIMTQT